MRFVLLSIAAWAAGVAAYCGTLAVIWQQFVGWDDLPSLAFVSAGLLFVPTPFLYLPLMHLIHQRCPLTRAWPFMLVACLAGVVPMAIVLWLKGAWISGLRGLPAALIAPEIQLFSAMFLAFGITFGYGFRRIARDSR